MFAAMPLMNPEACYQRPALLIERGELAGVVDITKPVIVGARASRQRYAASYDRVLACTDLVAVIEEIVAQASTSNVPLFIQNPNEANSVRGCDSR
jgi:hypothetical protein